MRRIEMIPSKSDAHRAKICAALSEITSGKGCLVQCGGTSQDIEATEKCLSALKEGRTEMYCGESGSTLRFLLPVAAALGRDVSFYTEGRLPKRPLSPLYEELERHGCKLSPKGSSPLTVKGKLKHGTFTIAGDVSSQYISGLLFALPLLAGDSRICIEGRLQSRPYVDMTLETLRRFGIEIRETEEGFLVRGGQKYEAPETYRVEGDWSNACFWLAAGAFTEGGIAVSGLSAGSLQGDKEILSVLKKFGADVKIEEREIVVSPGELCGIEIDASQIPDMVPVLAAVACTARGTTVIKHAERLRLKESDRLASVTRLLSGLGADIEELSDGLVINGKNVCGAGCGIFTDRNNSQSRKDREAAEDSTDFDGFPLAGGRADGAGDHRIVMTAAVASLLCRDKVRITGADAVKKSYPGFFEDMRALGLDGNIIY
ncbi:MAG: 3-phosphoshikimate 1-carboxyvinyltransferase [Emergencia sp.]|nr:3-phosphoshikimate 1-carboxyvinyltransferase [Emergencia sp.]